MSSNDLNAPLGLDKRKGLPKLPAAMPQILAGVLGLFAIAVVAWVVFVNDPLGGEPTAVVATGPPPLSVVTPAAPKPPPGSKTITIIDGSSGR